VEKASTGYTWHYYSSEANAFSLFSKESSVDQSEKAVQGGGSKVTWLFSPEPWEALQLFSSSTENGKAKKKLST